MNEKDKCHTDNMHEKASVVILFDFIPTTTDSALLF